MILHGYSFDHMDYNKVQKILKRWECQSTVPVSWETCIQVKKQQSEPGMEQWTCSKIEKRIWQGCILSLYLFKLHAEHIM